MSSTGIKGGNKKKRGRPPKYPKTLSVPQPVVEDETTLTDAPASALDPLNEPIKEKETNSAENVEKSAKKIEEDS